ncbi:MAG: DUF4391 domain-containing protein [Planctomycetes bacterium]|nr:DUF4391 domain-containing protein [Planctomycetota bacterium]
MLVATLRGAGKPTRLIESIQRARPDPVLLVAEQGASVHLSLAHKRHSSGAIGQVVVEELRVTVLFRDSACADDVAKTDLTAILQQHGLEKVRSL